MGVNSGKLTMTAGSVSPKCGPPNFIGLVMNRVTADLTPMLAATGFFKDVPFDNVAVSIFFDAEDGEPVLGKVVEAYDELPINIVMAGKPLRWTEDGSLREPSDGYVYDAIAKMCFRCLSRTAEEYDISSSGRIEDLKC